MSGAGKGGEKPWEGQFTDEPVEVPEFTDLLHDLRIPQAKLAEMAGVPKNALGRWSRGSLNPRYGRAMKTLDAVERRLREKVERVQAVRRSVREAHGRGRDRTRDAEIEGEYINGEGHPQVAVEGEPHELDIHDRPRAVTYMLLKGDEVVYVGHSTNLFWRLGHHEREKDFDSFAYLEMGTKKRAMELERALIRQLQPAYNDLMTSGPPKPHAEHLEYLKGEHAKLPGRET